MLKPPASNSSDLYLDFAQFNQMRKLTRDDEGAALQAAARQMEGIFLNMMLQSMRDANAVFAEGNMLESRDTQFYQGMYDKQLSLNISNSGGLGLADVIVKQMQANSGKELTDAVTDITGYLKHPLPARSPASASPHNEMGEPLHSDSTVLSVNQASNVNEKPEPSSWRSPAEFVHAIYAHAKRAGQRLGVAPEAIVAQAVLETGWGQHVMSDGKGGNSFNLFGIKADSRWDGETVRKNTLEYRNGIAAKENASFRSYPSLDQAFADYVDFLNGNSRYEAAINKNCEAKQWAFELQGSGYATDPNYGNKIANIIESDVFKSALNSATEKL